MALDLNTMHLTFDDEFNSFSLYNGVSGTWNPTYGFGGWNNFASRTLTANHEAEVYVDPAFAGNTSSALGVNPFSINDGILNITAAPTSPELVDALGGYQYTSGLITTRESFQQTYGYFEMRADLPQGQGLWPAFWLMPASGNWPPELDVMEMLGNNPSTIYSTVFSNGPTGIVKSAFGSNVADTSAGFHTYGVDWEPDLITWYFDGQQIAQTATPADLNSPMYLLANLAVGGAGSWPGSPDATTPLPAKMQIDYIRAYAAGPGQSAVAGPTAPGGTASTMTAGVTAMPDANHQTSDGASTPATTAAAMPDTNLASGSGTHSGSTVGATATPDTHPASQTNTASADATATTTSVENVVSSGSDTSPSASSSGDGTGMSGASGGASSGQSSTDISQAGHEDGREATLTEQSGTSTTASHHDTTHSVLGMAAIAPLVEEFQHSLASSLGEGSAGDGAAGASGAGGGGGAAAPAFHDLGLTFNDATRALEGGLWQNVVEEGGQGFGSIGRYTTDLQNVQTGLQAEVAAAQFTGDTLNDVNTILADITTALSAATASVSGGGTFGSVAAAEAALHNAHLDILNVVNNDANLTGLATQDGTTGFLAAPAALPAGTNPADAPHANLAEIGAIFNDLANISLGGFNADNSAQATADVNAIVTDMQGLMAANPLLFGGLTGVHADTVVRQLQLETAYIQQAGVTPDAGRASNDNLLDIIDIVQGDTNLANMANQGGVSGFTPFGDALNPTPQYQDNDAQTQFWANFIAQSNSLGQQAIAAVNAHDAAATATLISDLQAFQTTVTNFDKAQGGIFEARFDNELLGDTSTLGAEVAAMIKGLQNGDAALVSAAAEEMHANAADVGGNNLPVTGGAYNTDGLTGADVLSTAVAQGDAGAAAGDTSAGAGAGAGAGTGAAGGGTGAAGSGTGAGGGAAAGAGVGAGAGSGAGGCSHDHGHSDHGGSIANDIAALLQVMLSANSTAINSAVTALGNDVHNAGAAEVDSMTAALNNHHHFEVLWHH